MKLYISMLNAMKDAQRGAAMPEYGLLVALIAVVALGAVGAVGGGVTTAFNGIAGALGGVVGTP